MSVKTIFKVLIGTIVLMVSISLIIELYNISTSGMQIRYATKISAYQACVLFTQETYKNTDGKSGTLNVENVTTHTGVTYVSGDFYGSGDAKTIWDSIYTAPEFKAFCDTHVDVYGNSDGNTIAEQYKDLDLLCKAMNGTLTVVAPPSWDDSEATYDAYNDYTRAISMQQNMYTASNIGVPYLDDEIVNKIFRWNIARVLSNCDSDSVQQDEQGQLFINYKGFRCYAQQATISEYEYVVCDLSSGDGRTKFKSLTGMDANRLGLASDDAENNKITVVGINYTIPVSYIGITPIRRIFNYTWNNQAAGFSGNGYSSAVDQQWADEALASVGNGVHDGIEELEAGGLFSNDDSTLPTNSVPTTGRLIYTLVR